MRHQQNETASQSLWEGERCAWISFNTLAVLISLFGNLTILIATIKHRALKLHRILVIIIQHLAIADIFQIVFKVVPTIISYMARTWILPMFFCHLQYHVSVFFTGTTVILTCALTTTKMLLIKLPFRSTVWSTRQGHGLCTAIWVSAICLHSPQLAASILYGKRAICFDFSWYSCNYNYEIVLGIKWPNLALVIIFAVGSTVTFSVIVYSSITLLFLARRVAAIQQSNIRSKGVSTVLLTLVALIISYFPWMVIYPLNVESSQVWRFAQNIQNLNLMANFFIYTGTVKSFRMYLLRKLFYARSLLLSQDSQSTSASAQRSGRRSITHQETDF